MVPRLNGWTRQIRGPNAGTLVPPQGEGMGWIQYVEDVTPLRPIEALIADVVAAPGLSATHVGATEWLTTLDGRRAAIVGLRGTFHGHAIQRDVAFVMSADWFTCIASVVLDPRAAAWFTEIVWHTARATRNDPPSRGVHAINHSTIGVVE